MAQKYTRKELIDMARGNSSPEAVTLKNGRRGYKIYCGGTCTIVSAEAKAAADKWNSKRK